MKRDFDEPLSAEDLKNWQKDARGKWFWDTVREMAVSAVTDLRMEIKKGNLHKAAEWQAHIETLEEILQLPDKIIQTAADEKEREEQMVAAEAAAAAAPF